MHRLYPTKQREHRSMQPLKRERQPSATDRPPTLLQMIVKYATSGSRVRCRAARTYFCCIPIPPWDVALSYIPQTIKSWNRPNFSSAGTAPTVSVQWLKQVPLLRKRGHHLEVTEALSKHPLLCRRLKPKRTITTRLTMETQPEAAQRHPSDRVF